MYLLFYNRKGFKFHYFYESKKILLKNWYLKPCQEWRADYIDIYRVDLTHFTIKPIKNVKNFLKIKESR